MVTSFDQLKTAGPDASSVALTTTLTSKAAGDYVIKEFETQTGVPSAGGVLPSGSTLSFNLWMRKTANVGTVKPEARVRLNSATGTSLCSVTGSTALNTTVTKMSLSCTTTASVTMAATDRFYLWVGVNLSATSSTAFSGELDIEGTLNGNFDSQVTLPIPRAGLSPTSLSFANQIVNTTSGAKAVTLTNNQTSTALAISGVTTSGDYSQSNNCGTSLAALASCTINVTFKPTATGARTGTLTVTDNANNSPQTASLTGVGIALSSISVTPANPSVTRGLTQQFTATGTYTDNSTQNLTNTATWTSGTTTVATINSAGLATTVATGSSTIKATSGTISGSTTLTVTAPVLQSIAVTPANPSVPKGATQQFKATGTFSDNSTQDLTTSATWSSSSTSVATITSGGSATAKATGSSTITAKSGTISGTTKMTVIAPALASIAVTPANPSIPKGNQQQFSATGTFTDGSTQNLTSSATWSSLNTAAATINASGAATGVGTGSATIQAASGSISGTTTLTVTPPVLSSITVSPASASIISGTTQQFSATGTYTDGSTQNLTSSAAWSSYYPAIATINNAGLAAGVSAGTTYIQATSGTISSSFSTLVVTTPLPPVVQVQPANTSTNVPLNGRVVIRFAQAVSPASIVSGTLTLQQGTTSVAGTVTLSNDGLSLTFAPSPNLTTTTAYTVAVQDVASGQTSPMFQSSFTTGTATDTVAPSVLQSSPQNQDTNVPVNAPVVVQFSKAMDPATLTTQNFKLFYYANSQQVLVPGMVQVDASGRTASFVPQQMLYAGIQPIAVLSSGVQDTSGNHLPSAYTVQFTTSFAADNQGPTLLGVSPSNGSTAIPQNAIVVAEFDKPLDLITAASGFQVQTGGVQVAGSIAFSDGNRRITFTPTGGLIANTTYTILATTQVTNVAGLPLTNPGTFTFTTGNTTDTVQAHVTSVSPLIGATGVPTNAIVQVAFSKPIDPLTVTAATFQVVPGGGGQIAGTFSVTLDGLTATFTPSNPLAPSTVYTVTVNGVADLEGQIAYLFGSPFTTGLAPGTTPSVIAVSPRNGATRVPINPQVMVLVSGPIDPISVTSTTITLSAGGTPVTGTVNLSSDATTLTFAPGGLLLGGTAYTVTVSGLKDQTGNPVTTFSSSFTTATSGEINPITPAVVSVSPLNGATSVSVTSPIVLTFNEALNPISINGNTVQVSATGFGGTLAGSFALDSTGEVVTFTPASPMPGAATIQVNASGVLDLSGKQGPSFSSSFTTAATADTTAPTVVSVTPGNGATGVGVNGAVVLTFSKSLNANTVNSQTIALLVNGQMVGTNISLSADNRMVTLKPGSLPSSSTIIIVATSAVQDISGNALVGFESQFTTAGSFDIDQPSVAGQRPANGATGVPLNAGVLLYLSEPMNPASLTAALHIAQNGVLVNGAVQVSNNGQVVQFTPSSPWQGGAVVWVEMDNTAQDVDGNRFTNNYYGSFTTLGNPLSQTPALISTFPGNNSANVATNVVFNAAYDQALNPATVNTSTVPCFQNSTAVASSVTLLNGTVIQLTPNPAFAANTPTRCMINGVNGADGFSVPFQEVDFTTGSGPDTTLPTMSAAPTNGAVNVPDNATIRLGFNKPVNAMTVNPNSVQLSAGGSAISGSFSFSAGNEFIQFVPYSPLPDATAMTLTVNGIKDYEGHAVASQTNHFTTGTGPDLVAPVAVSENPSNNTTNVATNAVIQVQASKPLDLGTVNGNTFYLQTTVAGNTQNIAANYTLSPDGRTMNLLPIAPLPASQNYSVVFSGRGVTDLAGNALTCGTVNPSCEPSFATGTGPDTVAPQVVGVSPANGLTGVPINAQVVIQFSKQVDVTTLSQVTVSAGSTTVGVTNTLSNGNQTLILVPFTLALNTTYTVNVSGVQDMSGNALAAPVTTSFTTGTTADWTAPAILNVYPANQATAAPTNTVIQIEFSKRIDLLTVNPSTFAVSQSSTPVTGTISISADGQTATFTPASALLASTTYSVAVSTSVTDLVGNSLPAFSSSFTTGTAAMATPSIAWINPASAFAGTSVTISGVGFGSPQGSSTVTFNGVTATPTSWNNNEIVVPVPSGATSGNIVATVSGAASNGVLFNVLATPSVTSLSQSSGAVGTPITITGTNFGTSLDSRIVKFNGVTVTPTAGSWTSTSVVATVPATATVGPVTVVVNGISSNANQIFTPLNPVITTLVPSAAGTGAVIKLQGTGFGATQGASSIQFNGVQATNIVSWSDTLVKVTVPQTATSGNVTLTLAGITSNGVAFSVEQLSITAISPIAGSPGTSVTIAGTGFGTSQGDSSVNFNGTLAAVSSWSDQRIVAVVSQGSTNGPVNVIVGGVTAQGGPYSVDFTALLTDSLGNQTSYKAAVVGGTWYVTDVVGSGCSSCSVRGTTHTEYDSNGNVLSETNALGQTTSYTYDANDNMTSVSAGGATTIYTYNSFGEPLTVTDPLGNITTNKYDNNGNLASVTSPAPDASTPASVTQFAYDPKGELIQIADPLGNPTTLTYTPAGLIASIKDAQSNVTSYQYDAHGNRTLVTDPLNNQTTFAYDAGDRLTKITYPDQTFASFGYDYRGRRISSTDQNGNTTNYAYDDADRLFSVTDAALNVTTYTYDSENNLLGIVDAKQNPTSFKYDAFGRVTETDFPSSIAEIYTYDAIGNLTSKTDRKGQKIQYVYDALSHLTHVGYPDTTGADYVYDLAGKIKQVADPSGRYGFAYDNLGRLIGTTTQYAPPLPGKTFAVNYTYDAAGNRKSMRDAENGTTTYSYDTLNRLQNVLDFNNNNFGFSYDALSRRTQMTRPNGINTSYTYDSLSQLLSVLHQSGGVTIDGASYGLDAASNRTSKADLRTNVTSGYGYDKIYELLQATQGVTTTESYTYDPVGNRLSSLSMASYNYNPSNELTSTPGGSYTYDANGNTLTDASGKSYAWDFNNRLSQVTLPNAGGTESFKYDSFGRRIQKLFTHGGTTAVTNYIYDGDDLIEELDGNGNQVARYSYNVENVDEPLAMSRSGTNSFFEQDNAGSITSLTNGSAAITDTYSYDSFGQNTGSSGTTINPFRYSGREFDAETSLLYLRARYYDPTTGRFISEDPSGSDDDNNLYSYVHNSPTNAVDLFGTAMCTLRFRFGRGTLTCYPTTAGEPTLEIPVASGNNGENSHCKNNHACDPKRARGPIPIGYWTWTNNPPNSKPNGRRLKPLPITNTYNRSGILSHSCLSITGPSKKPPFCSEGCVTGEAKNMRKLNRLLDAETNNILLVQGP